MYCAECGQEHYYFKQGFISSPGYPNTYGNNLNCIYYVHSPPESLVTLYFNLLDLEYSTGCRYDVLQVSKFLFLLYVSSQVIVLLVIINKSSESKSICDHTSVDHYVVK